MTNQATNNYFLADDYSLDALRYIRLDLLQKRHLFQKEHGFFDNQAQMFARMADEAKSNLGAVNLEFKLVEEAIYDLKMDQVQKRLEELQEKKVS
jgi:hypothetical protein